MTSWGHAITQPAQPVQSPLWMTSEYSSFHWYVHRPVGRSGVGKSGVGALSVTATAGTLCRVFRWPDPRVKNVVMDLSYPPEAEAFRKEIRTWLEENLPEGWFDEGFELKGDERKQFNADWVKKLQEGGWICASWPKEYGGKGLSVIENVVLNEEFAARRCTDAG